MRTSSFIVFMSFVLASTTLSAQRMSGGARGGPQVANGNRMAPGISLSGPRGDGHHHQSGDGTVLVPYGYWGDWEDSGWDYSDYPPPDNGAQEPSYPQAANPPSRPAALMASEQPVATPAQSPKLVEIPLSKDSAAVRSQAAAVFVLTSGERLESHRYVLTSQS